MRRFLGPVLLGLGVFLLVLAGMLRFYVADRVVVTPIDQYAQTVAPGPGTYLDPAVLQERSTDLVATRTLKADVAASNKDTAVWDVSVVLSTGTGTFVRATVDRVATDRRTAEAVNCCGEAVDGARPGTRASVQVPVRHAEEGLRVLGPQLEAGAPAKFVSEEKIQGLTTYKFLQVIPPTQLRPRRARAAGGGERQRAAPVYYSTTRTVWVEPRPASSSRATSRTRPRCATAPGRTRPRSSSTT